MLCPQGAYILVRGSRCKQDNYTKICGMLDGGICEGMVVV